MHQNRVKCRSDKEEGSGSSMEYRIVIIDDEKEISGGFAMFFPWKSLGFSVAAQFTDARMALEFLKKEEADILISDVRMPGMDGLQMAEEMRRLKLPHPPKLVFFSAYGEFKYAQKAMDCGAVKYILKTTPYDELVAIFKELKENLDEEAEIVAAGIRKKEQEEPDGTDKTEMEQHFEPAGSSPIDVRPALEEDFQDDKILAVMKQYIDGHLQSVSLDTLAEQVYMSPAYVSRYFKQKTGQNFQEYLIAKRMEKAAVLLEDLQYQIGDVSEMVGYRNPFNFSRTFKKFYGVNPRDYRLGKPEVHSFEKRGGSK